MARLILLNGAPGVGKSTLARRYAQDHPGTLVLEIDVLRTMVAGWQDDPMGAGARIRSAALATMGAYLAEGGDVLVPQLLADPAQAARLEATAATAGATYVQVVLDAPAVEVVRRFRGRAEDHPWAGTVTEIVDADGGDEALVRWVEWLDGIEAVRVPSTDVESTYAALLVALDGAA